MGRREEVGWTVDSGESRLEELKKRKRGSEYLVRRLSMEGLMLGAEGGGSQPGNILIPYLIDWPGLACWST